MLTTVIKSVEVGEVDIGQSKWSIKRLIVYFSQVFEESSSEEFHTGPDDFLLEPRNVLNIGAARVESIEITYPLLLIKALIWAGGHGVWSGAIEEGLYVTDFVPRSVSVRSDHASNHIAIVDSISVLDSPRSTFDEPGTRVRGSACDLYLDIICVIISTFLWRW